MARIYELKPTAPNGGGLGWNMDECEEKVLIAVYADVRNRIQPAKWKDDFELHFYDLGKGVSHYSLKMINGTLKRLGREPVEVVETNVGEYARNSDWETKARIREKTLRDQYLALDPAGKIQWLNSARDATRTLEPPHQTYLEITASRREKLTIVSDREMANRTKALKDHTVAAEVKDSADRPARVMRQLMLTQKPELIAKIIETLKPDEALDLAEQVDAQEIRDLLVERSMVEVA